LVQETKWLGAKVREIDGYKFWYLWFNRAKNKVGILVDKELANQVVNVRHGSDYILTIKLVVRSEILNVASVYTPQSDKFFVGGDINRHIAIKTDGDNTIHRIG